MEQYLTHIDYALWEVIVNGDAAAAIASVSGGAEAAIPLKTTEQKIVMRNELKAKSTLLFGGNKESKKMQKTILKQQYENFAASRSEGLDKTYDSLPPAWNTHTLIMQNKSDIDTLSIDDLYNNLKVYEAKIKGQSSSSSNSQNMAFVSSNNTSSTNEAVNIAYNVSAASSQGQASASTYADDIDTDDLDEMDLKWQVVMLTLRVNRFIKKTRRNLNFNGKETVGFDKTNVECYNYHKRGHFSIEFRVPKSQRNRNGDNTRRVVPVETPANALVVTDGMGYDWSYQAEEGPTDFALMTYSSLGSSSSDTETGLGYDSQLNERDLNNKSDVFESASDSSVNESEEDNNQENDRYKAGEGYHAVPPPYTGNFMPSRPDMSLAGLDDYVFKFAISETVTSVHETETSASKTSKESMEKPKTVRNFVPTSVITNSGKVPVNTGKQSSPRAATSTSTARYVNTAATRPTVNGAKPSSNVFHEGHSPVRRIFNQRTAPKNSNLKEIINTAKGNSQYTLKDQRIFDSGCFRHMIGNKSFLTDYQEIDGGFVAFGRSPKGDHLGKFEGKTDEGFLVKYSINSKAFRVFNSRTRKVEENLHIKFLENKSNVEGRGPEWLFDIDSLTKSMNYEPVTSLDDKDTDEVPSKRDKGVSEESEIDNQERTDSSTQDVNTAGPSINTANTNINTGSLNINAVGSNDPSMPSLKETGIFDDVYDDRKVGAEADINNLELSTVAKDFKIHLDWDPQVASKPEIIAYQVGLESLEARIVVHEKNKAVYEEDIKIFKIDVMLRDNALAELKNQMKNALKEKDDLKLKLEKFEASSHNLTKLINCQLGVNNKTSLGYDSQMNKSDLNDVHVNESQELDSEDENVVKKPEVKKTVKPSLEKIEFVNARNTTVENESKAKKPRKLRQSPRGTKLEDSVRLNSPEDKKQIAAANTIDTEEVQITAKINGKVKLVSEASIRRHLKLEDSDGISTFPNTEIFEQLALIGASKGYTRVDVPLFQTMLVQGPILQGEGSTVPVESHHTPLDEAASTGVDVRHGGSATTVSSLDARQGNGNIDKTQFMPHDSPLQRVKKLEKTIKLSQIRRRENIVVSDDEELEDPSKQGRSMIEEIDQDTEVHLVTPTQVNTQEESRKSTWRSVRIFSADKVLAEVAKVHTCTRRRSTISTASGETSTAEESVSTAGASMSVSTAGMVDTGKAIMQESEPELITTKLKQRQERAGYEAAIRLQEQLDEEERHRIARMHEEATSFNVVE
nr:hypothetical protein [Tanacetum cinerariifolium]